MHIDRVLYKGIHPSYIGYINDETEKALSMFEPPVRIRPLRYSMAYFRALMPNTFWKNIWNMRAHKIAEWVMHKPFKDVLRRKEETGLWYVRPWTEFYIIYQSPKFDTRILIRTLDDMRVGANQDLLTYTRVLQRNPLAYRRMVHSTYGKLFSSNATRPTDECYNVNVSYKSIGRSDIGSEIPTATFSELEKEMLGTLRGTGFLITEPGQINLDDVKKGYRDTVKEDGKEEGNGT